MSKGTKIIIFTGMFIALAMLLLSAANSPQSLLLNPDRPTELSVSALRQKIGEEQVRSVEWQGTMLRGKLADNKSFVTNAYAADSQAGADLQQLMSEKGVKYEIDQPPAGQSLLLNALVFLLPTALILAFFWFFLVRPAQSGGNQAMSFGKSRARRAGEMNTKITFDDVAGIEEAKQELYEIVDFLKNTKKYVSLGAKIPKGILLTGPPGVGKTHLARAIAGEAGVPFFHISGSDFVEMFVGVGAARVRDLFETAKAHRPCLLFVDEIDAVGRQRGAGLGGGHDEREQTLNQLLVEMDGFDANTGVIVIAATNRPDVLDPALLRPGRFDRHIVVDTPDAKGRAEILRIHSKGKPLSEDVDLPTIAKRSPGFTGADLANTLNEAALLAARRNQGKVRMIDIEEALDRVMAGPQRRSRVMDGKEREIIAYHEAGHALVGEKLEHCDPVHKVTILPRGTSLGSTWALPEKDVYLHSKSRLLDNITMTLGGRVAEEIVFNESYTGAYGDLQQVTRVARAMVTEYGMSDRLGTRAIGRKNGSPFLGRDYIEDRDYSEDVAKVVDEEVHDIVERCRQRCYDILTTHRTQLDAVVDALLERETLNRDEFLAVLDGRELPPLPEIEAPAPKPEANEGEESARPPMGSQRLEPGPA